MNERFRQAITWIDEANANDPRQELVGDKAIPHELLYAQRLTEWVLRLQPAASETLLLAARSQHICRWKIARADYPLTKAGYHQWKNDLKRFHATLTEQILRKAGYDETTIERVKGLNLKAGFPEDPDSRTLEDALCLVFLQYQFGSLAERAEPGKVVNALRKSWGKMTDCARKEALRMEYTSQQRALLEAALKPAQANT